MRSSQSSPVQASHSVLLVLEQLLDHSARKSGFNRSCAEKEFTGLIPSKGHSEDLQQSMSALSKKYVSACWKRGFCVRDKLCQKYHSLLHNQIFQKIIDSLKKMFAAFKEVLISGDVVFQVRWKRQSGPALPLASSSSSSSSSHQQSSDNTESYVKTFLIAPCRSQISNGPGGNRTTQSLGPCGGEEVPGPRRMGPTP